MTSRSSPRSSTWVVSAAAAGSPAAAAAAGAAVPKRVAVFAEPSPFHYVCGYQNRYKSLIRYLREQGCEVSACGAAAPREERRRTDRKQRCW